MDHLEEQLIPRVTCLQCFSWSWSPWQTGTYLNQEAEASQAAICKINVWPFMQYRNIKLGWTKRQTISFCYKLTMYVHSLCCTANKSNATTPLKNNNEFSKLNLMSQIISYCYENNELLMTKC